jgi:hypothetical protein
VRFSVEVAKAFGAGRCSFYDPANLSCSPSYTGDDSSSDCRERFGRRFRRGSGGIIAERDAVMGKVPAWRGLRVTVALCEIGVGRRCFDGKVLGTVTIGQSLALT